MAASSSYTYYLSHPDDDDTRQNIRYYRDSLKVPESDFQDLEITPFKVKVFGIKGELSFDDLLYIKELL